MEPIAPFATYRLAGPAWIIQASQMLEEAIRAGYGFVYMRNMGPIEERSVSKISMDEALACLNDNEISAHFHDDKTGWGQCGAHQNWLVQFETGGKDIGDRLLFDGPSPAHIHAMVAARNEADELMKRVSAPAAGSRKSQSL